MVHCHHIWHRCHHSYLLGYFRCGRACRFGCCLDCFCTLCQKIQNMVMVRESRYLVRFVRSRPMILTSCPKKSLPNLLILPTSSYNTSQRRRSSFSAATITLFFLITSRLGARRLRRSKHLSPRKPQKQKLKCIP